VSDCTRKVAMKNGYVTPDAFKGALQAIALSLLGISDALKRIAAASEARDE
jgi:hypothetical protein